MIKEYLKDDEYYNSIIDESERKSFEAAVKNTIDYNGFVLRKALKTINEEMKKFMKGFVK